MLWTTRGGPIVAHIGTFCCEPLADRVSDHSVVHPLAQLRPIWPPYSTGCWQTSGCFASAMHGRTGVWRSTGLELFRALVPQADEAESEVPGVDCVEPRPHRKEREHDD